MSRKAVRVVTMREIRQRLRDRGFLVTSALLLAIVVVPPVLISAATSGQDRYTVGSLDDESAALLDVARDQAPLFDAELETRTVDDRQEAETLVTEGELDAVVADGRELIVDSDVEDGLASLLGSSAVLEEAGTEQVSPQDAALTVAPQVSEARSQTTDLAPFAIILLFVVIYLSPYFVAASVVEEKASRVIEVILSSVRPNELLAGKVLGLGILGLAQIAIILILGVLVGAGSGVVELSPELLALIVAVIASFVIGYLFYGFLFAVAGAVVSRSEDLQYSVLAPMVVLFVGFFGSRSQASDPSSTLAQVLALLPPTAPFMLPVRIGAGEAGAVELLASAIIALAAIAVIAWAAGRLYAGSVLRFGGRVGLTEAWRR